MLTNRHGTAILSYPQLSHFNLPSLKRAGKLRFLEFRSAIVSCPLELLLKVQKVKPTRQILIEEQACVSTLEFKVKISALSHDAFDVTLLAAIVHVI